MIRTGSDADLKIGPAARSFAADAHDCIMVRTSTPYRIQVCGVRYASIASSLGSHRPSACSGVKALPNTSAARRQAAKLCYRFAPLTPSARSANLIASDGTKNGFPAPNKKRGLNQNTT